MAAPSFSSFPPTFSSFPDTEPEASTSKQPAERSSRSKRDRSDKKPSTHKHRRDKDSKEDKEERKRKKKHSRPHKDYDLFEDELKSKAQARDESETLPSAVEDAPLYYTDRKGDPLNVTYGGLHTYHIPKHHLVDRKYRSASSSSRSNC